MSAGIHDYLRNPLKRAVAEMLYESQRGKCQLCGGERRLEIDHIDGRPTNWKMSNLRLLCHECNIAERNRQGYLTERERENLPQTDRFALQVISDSVHNPTSRQRSSWDPWVRGKALVPTMDQFAFPLLRGLKSNPPMRIFESGREIVRLAVHACGFGSSKTYWEYLMEDCASGLFERKMGNGEYLVAYTEEFAEIVLMHVELRRP